MKKISFLIIVFIFILTVNVFAQQKVVRVASLEWPPYSSAFMTGKGTAVQTLENSLYAANIGMIIDFLPWERALLETKEGKYDAIFPAWPEEVPEGFVATTTVANSSVSVIGLSDSDIIFASLEDLFKSKKVALVRGYKYSKEIMDLSVKYSKNVIFPSNDQLMMRMLSTKARFDVCITDFSVASYYSIIENRQAPKEIHKLYDKPLVVAVKKDSELLGIINNLIEKNKK